MMKHPLDWTPRFEDWEDRWFPADRKLLDPLFSRSAARQRGYCNILYPANLWCFTKLSHGFQKITSVLPGFFGHNTVLFHMKLRVGVQRGVSDSPSQVGSVGISKSNGLVMKVSAVDYLAATTVICTDKTGTLTEARPWWVVGHGLMGKNGENAWRMGFLRVNYYSFAIEWIYHLASCMNLTVEIVGLW